MINKKTPWNKGKKNIYSEETRSKMRLAKLGRKLTEEHKRKIGLKSKGNKHRLGGIPWNKGLHYKTFINPYEIIFCARCNAQVKRTGANHEFCESCMKIKDVIRKTEWLKNPDNRKIHNARSLAFKKIPLKDSCEICTSTYLLQRHHWNYDKPLLVNTLCSDCHNIQHVKDFNKSIFMEVC